MKSLKEWASVIAAMEDGVQTVLLRKGGILDIASGFRVESNRFFLFPTAEHQGHSNIRSKFHGYLERADPHVPAECHTITSYADVLAEADVYSEESAKSLSKFHIWSESYIDERRRWNEKPLKALFLRVYKIPQLTIQSKPEYAGCKSWIDIGEDVPDGTPVLDAVEAESRLDEFRRIVQVEL